jgi:PPOX class probable FMN-dependent enzyme
MHWLLARRQRGQRWALAPRATKGLLLAAVRVARRRATACSGSGPTGSGDGAKDMPRLYAAKARTRWPPLWQPAVPGPQSDTPFLNPQPMDITDLKTLRALYDPVRERSALKELPRLDHHAMRFIAHSPLVVVASAGLPGTPPQALDASPRGGEPGFVKVPDAGTLLIPDAPGNNRLDTLENIARHVAAGAPLGLLFLLPGVDETLRVNGTAHLSTDAHLCQRCADARRVPRLVIRVQVQASYLHCAKALMRSALWDASRHVQRSVLPSMGEMLRDQIGDRMSTDTPAETQAQMLERYRQTL